MQVDGGCNKRKTLWRALSREKNKAGGGGRRAGGARAGGGDEELRTAAWREVKEVKEEEEEEEKAHWFYRKKAQISQSTCSRTTCLRTRVPLHPQCNLRAHVHLHVLQYYCSTLCYTTRGHLRPSASNWYGHLPVTGTAICQ